MKLGDKGEQKERTLEKGSMFMNNYSTLFKGWCSLAICCPPPPIILGVNNIEPFQGSV